jgi:hypothetical protein
MGFINKLLSISEQKWLWWVGTLIGSFVPVICRLINGDHPLVDIKDILFAGLAMNICNLPLLTNDSFNHKLKVGIFSAGLIFFIGLFLGKFLNTEGINLNDFRTWISVVLVWVSIMLSREINNNYLQNVNR